MASQATRVKEVWSVLKVQLAQLAHRVLLEHKVKMDRKGNEDQLDLKVTLDHMGLLVKKVTWEREASRVIWDLQVQKEKLVKEEMWDKKVNQVTEG